MILQHTPNEAFAFKQDTLIQDPNNNPKHTTERLIRGMQMRKLKDILEKRAKDNRRKYEEKVVKQKTWLIPTTSSAVIDPKAAGISTRQLAAQPRQFLKC